MGDDYYSIGINGKNSEFHAAMGLVNLKHIQKILEQRKILTEYYDQKLVSSGLTRPLLPGDLIYNYSYYPVIFETEKQLLKAIKDLQSISVNPRRYFYPSLNRLPFIVNKTIMPVSESVSSRVLCLPLFNDLEKKDIDLICGQLLKRREE